MPKYIHLYRVPYVLTILRHMGFYFALTVWTVLFIPIGIILLFLPKKYTVFGARFYCQFMMLIYKLFLKISFRIHGQEHIPLGPCIIACKHQSSWETFALMTILKNPSFILKSEIMRIPLGAALLKKLDMIPVKRHSSKHLKSMDSDGSMRSRREHFLHQVRDITHIQKRPCIIFPEGTRTKPGQITRYRQGVAVLAEQLQLSVIPVALNSGRCIPVGQFFTHPGIIDIVFLPAILPNIPAQELLEKIKRAIEEKSSQL